MQYVIKAKLRFKQLLINSGYSQEVADELWKWYDSSEKKALPASEQFL